MPAGRVASLQRWPVKGMGGEFVDALSLDAFGAAGDRSHAVFDVVRGAPRRINAKTAPRLLAWAAAYPPNGGGPASRDATPQPSVTGPDGSARAWDDPALPAALAQDLGRDEVTLTRQERGEQDRPMTVHLTIAASLDALAATLGRPVDVRRFRSNIHLDLDCAPFAEEGWVGRRLRIGDAELEVVERCERCPIPGLDPDTQAKWPGLLRLLADEHRLDFGLIARVAAPAVVRSGDPAELL
jgi:uncharacterized protein YcbX